jgi:flavin-dependent dehydrogenase
MLDYDVIVAGCGPAGLTAAAELKGKGVNVLGIDKKVRLDENIRSASGFCIDGQDMNGEYVQLEPLNGKTKINFTKCVSFGKPLPGNSPQETPLSPL